jgi:hypothetical protein
MMSQQKMQQTCRGRFGNSRKSQHAKLNARISRIDMARQTLAVQRTATE